MKRGIALAAIALAGGPAHADSDDPFDAETVSLQVGLGALGGAVGCGGLGLAGAGLGQLINPRNWGVPLAGAAIGCVIGGSVGLVWAVDFVGDEQGANGTLLGTSLGLLGGVILLGTFQTIAVKADWRVPGPVNVLLGLVTIVGAPIVGYHLTADDNGGVVSIPITGFVF